MNNAYRKALDVQKDTDVFSRICTICAAYSKLANDLQLKQFSLEQQSNDLSLNMDSMPMEHFKLLISLFLKRIVALESFFEKNKL